MNAPILSRRSVLLGGISVSAALALYYLPDFFKIRRTKNFLAQEFEQIFGPDIVQLEPSQRFLADYYSTRWINAAAFDPIAMARMFVQSSNLLEHHETGAHLEYDQLYDPYTTPCSNHLGANYSYQL
ncbi:MAG: hypothetical protein V3U96_12610 [Paracoccaceae bacterium]